MIDYARLPLGIASFSDFRERAKIYVDKTDLISILGRYDVPLFLSRPRRFGKSLLVSTIQFLFEHGLKYFQGLKIAKLWHDRQYKVLRIDFSGFDFMPDTFRQDFVRYLIHRCEKGGITLQAPPVTPTDVLDKISSVPENGRLVVLIDEYDAPLVKVLNTPDFKKMQEVLSAFYSALKSHKEDLRFVFITGGLLFAQTAIFSGFNELNDLFLDKRYAALLCFTCEDLQTYFAPSRSIMA